MSFLSSIYSAATFIPTAYSTAKSMYNTYTIDDSLEENLMVNVEPSCFAFMVANMAIAPELAKLRVTAYRSMIIDKNNSIRIDRNGDRTGNFIRASRNLYSHWQRILIIFLTIFPPVSPLHEILLSLPKQMGENKPQGKVIVDTSEVIEDASIEEKPIEEVQETEIDIKSIEVVQKKGNDKKSIEVVPRKGNDKKSIEVVQKAGSDKKSTGKQNNTQKFKEIKLKENNISTDTSSKNNSSPIQSNPEERSNRESTAENASNSTSNLIPKENPKIEPPRNSRQMICDYMIRGINKTIRSYKEDKTAAPTIAILNTYISLIQNALDGEKLPPIPGKPVGKSVIRKIKESCPDTQFDFVVTQLELGEGASSLDGFECPITQAACEEIENFTKKKGIEHDRFMNERANL